MSVTAGLEGILIKWLGFIKDLFITGQNIETVVDILGDILQDGRGMIGHDVYIDGRVSGLSVGSLLTFLSSNLLD